MVGVCPASSPVVGCSGEAGSNVPDWTSAAPTDAMCCHWGVAAGVFPRFAFAAVRGAIGGPNLAEPVAVAVVAPSARCAAAFVSGALEAADIEADGALEGVDA